jgi:putative peptidoglycan lipid II flippase
LNPVSAADAAPERPAVGHRVAGAAALIAALTVVSRAAGFGRTMVFAWAVGDNDLGDIYLAANQIPNIVFEIVAGGALASLVVPLLAGPIARGDRAAVARTVSALLTWTLSLLVPLAVLTAAGADLIIGWLDADASAAQAQVGAGMLRIFAPQLPLYGVGIVLVGVLQAHRRFAWPVLAPLLSSVTVAGAYLLFVADGGRGRGAATVSRSGELILAVGTTLGVAVLALCLVLPVRTLRLRLRPRYRFDGDVRRRVGGLAVAGAVTVAAQQLAMLVVLSRGMAGPDGTWVQFILAQTVFLLPWAVLAVPVATATYPGLAEAAATGREDRYRGSLAAATRAVLLLTGLGAAALVALARPGAGLLAAVMPGASAGALDPLAAGITCLAPGLLGYGLFALLSRALYARGDTAAAAAATAVGWAVAAATAVALSRALPAADRVAALTGAMSVGMTVLGAGLLVMVGRRAGRSALAGVGRAVAASVTAATLAAAGGYAVAAAMLPTGDHPPGVVVLVGSGMLTGVVVGAVFGAVVWALDRGDARPLVAAAVRRLRRAGTQADAGTEEARG